MRSRLSMRDGVARILRVGPGGDRRRAVHGELALPHQDADQGVGDRLGGRPADHLRVDRRSPGHSARRSPGHRARPPRPWCRDGAAPPFSAKARSSAALQRRLGRARPIAGPAMSGSRVGAGTWRRQGDRRGRLAVQHQAAQRAAIDGAGLGQAGEACRHLGVLAVDLVAEQEARPAPGRARSPRDRTLGLDPRDEGGRAELMADEACRHVGRAVEAAAARQQDRRGGQQATEMERCMNGSP